MKNMRGLGVFAASLFVVAALTQIVGKAASTFVTANASSLNYTLAAGATTSPISPATNTAVIIVSDNVGTSDFAASSITMVHIPGVMLRWVGMEPNGSIVHGGSTALGTHIAYTDNSSKVSLEVFSADAFVVHNGSTTSQTGTVKLIW
jgi:hypothetical protein